MKQAKRWMPMAMVALVALAGWPAAAASWNPLDWFAPRRVETLVVCGNLAQPRLLAEMAQRETKQSFLMLSPAPGGGEEAYVMLPDFSAFQATDAQIAELVQVIAPRRVILMGDSYYFPEAAATALANQYPTLVIRGDDWRQNAEALAQGLARPKLPARFNGPFAELEAKLALPEPPPPAAGAGAAPALPPLPPLKPATGTVEVLDPNPPGPK
ncbi:MAG: hypothetical protein WC789_13310 [Lentisphaeria bacterium]|jgi:hypothetical protein